MSGSLSGSNALQVKVDWAFVEMGAGFDVKEEIIGNAFVDKIVRANSFDAIFCGELLSRTRRVKIYVPGAEGVPEIVPSIVSKRPSGKFPPIFCQVYGPVPPEAERCILYPMFTYPVGNVFPEAM